jgi:hypothetical protein
MHAPALDHLQGYRRRIRITPQAGRVTSELEDDFHCMTVTVEHDGEVASAVAAVVHRAPWTTCPGAAARLRETFTGVPLAQFARRGEKRSNCTHLHDLAVLAAAHALDVGPLVYDILVADPIEKARFAELRRNGRTVLRWTEVEFRLVEPPEVAGMTLDKLGPWIETLEPARQEAARLLRWGTMVAHGRTIPLVEQSDASRMPLGNCYTFQPSVAAQAQRVGEIRNFSAGGAHPLDGAVPRVE